MPSLIQQKLSTLAPTSPKNRTTGITEVGGLQIGGWSGGQIIIDYQIYMTHKGKVVSLDVTPEILGKLREVRSIIHEVFDAVRHPDPSRPPQPD